MLLTMQKGLITQMQINFVSVIHQLTLCACSWSITFNHWLIILVVWIRSTRKGLLIMNHKPECVQNCLSNWLWRTHNKLWPRVSLYAPNQNLEVLMRFGPSICWLPMSGIFHSVHKKIKWGAFVTSHNTTNQYVEN